MLVLSLSKFNPFLSNNLIAQHNTDTRVEEMVSHSVSTSGIDLEFYVKDDDVFGAEVMGMVKIPAKRIVTIEFITVELWVLTK